MVLPTPGGIPRKDDFFDRDDEVAELWATLETSNILMVAPRRAGKTALMFKLIDEQASHGEFHVAYRNLQHEDDEADLFALIDRFTDVHRTPDPPRPYGVLMLDEFLSFVETILGTDDGLDWKRVRRLFEKFRAIRSDPDHSRWLRFVLAGSTSIDMILDRVGGNLLNDLRRLAIGVFDPLTTMAFIEALVADIDHAFSKRQKERIMALLGGNFPYFIQLYISELRYRLRGENAVSDTLLDSVYWSDIIGGKGSQYFSDYYQRLKKYGYIHPSLPKAARTILSAVAAADSLHYGDVKTLFHGVFDRFDPELFALLRTSLNDEFYLDYDTRIREFSFRFKLMRDWWRRWHPPEDRMFLDDRILIYRHGGLLIAHVSTHRIPPTDLDLFAGEFTAIIDFMHDTAFGQTRGITLDSGYYCVHTSEYLIVAVNVIGDIENERALAERMKRFIGNIETEYAAVLSNWDGDRAHFAGIEKMLSRL